MNHEDLKIGGLYRYNNEVVINIGYVKDAVYIVAKRYDFYGLSSKEIYDVYFSKLIGQETFENPSVKPYAL
jgi:hypothetical protein